MALKPMVRNNICLNAHPLGCAAAVYEQIEYTEKRAAERKAGKLAGRNERAENGRKDPKNVLVLGCSNGYGLASRIAAAFSYGANTLGVSFEKAGSDKKWGTPGWYNNLAFDKAAKEKGLVSVTLDGDAFSNEMKDNVIAAAKENNMVFDLVIYSLASPVRTDPATGIMHKSVIKPYGAPFTGKTVDPFTGELKVVTAEPADDEEIANTIKVMGGEDWKLWIDALTEAGTITPDCVTVAYSYIGPEVSQAIYRNGSIGKAKEHIEKTARELSEKMGRSGGAAYVSVNKGLVTRSSSVIPVIPLYLATLFTVMKGCGAHEGCIEQMNRLFDTRLFGTPCGEGKRIAELLGCKNDAFGICVDEENRIRVDDWEMDPAIQAEVDKIMPNVTSENSEATIDLSGYRHDFLATSGFDIAGVDYEADIDSFDHI